MKTMEIFNLNLQLISSQMFRLHFVINYGKISEHLWTPHCLEKYSWRKNSRGLLSCVLSTDRIEIHQSQPASMTLRRSEGQTSGCDWWFSIRSVDNREDWRKLIVTTSSNQRLWECVRRRLKFYTDTLNDFPSWLSTSKNQPFFINNRGFTERYFNGEVHAILIEEVPVQNTLSDGASFRRLTMGLKYVHHPSNFVLNILTLTCNV